MLSLIIPVFNEEESIYSLWMELEKYCPAETEFLFVNDGSSDNSQLEIEKLAINNSKIKCISFSRNFGHQNALMAGMHHAKGEQVIIMDGDLQHPPSLIPDILKKLSEGYDLVNTRRVATEKISLLKKIFTKAFYKFINAISDTSIEPNMADFKGFNKKVLKTILEFKERDLFLRGIFSWIGFKNYTVDFTAPARKFGKSKYSFSSMLRLALKGTTSFSFKPLRVALLIGSIISILAFSFALFALVAYYKGNTYPGWASMIIAIMFLGGTQLLAIGLLGEYIASLFTETKKRPLYIIDKLVNVSSLS